ncbi:hypothetical protein BKA70DRAFT_624197 [Coprinopsis sp. MPI-PUGE-AT-0042]|nr:hypothetical protein BKA70DRAFT_624197 [Coprinopsis sp. MPI-PUGE-AT-0042]
MSIREAHLSLLYPRIQLVTRSPTYCHLVLSTTHTDMNLPPSLPLHSDLAIESFRIYTPSKCTTSSRGTRLICVSLMVLQEEIIHEMLRNASKRTQMEPSCIIIQNIYESPTLSETRPVSFDPPASSWAFSPSLITKDHALVLMKISQSAQTRKTRIVEGTLPATPSTILHPSPGEIEGRAGLFELDEDMQVAVKRDGGHGVDGVSEELGSEDKDGTMRQARKLSTPSRTAGALETRNRPSNTTAKPNQSQSSQTKTQQQARGVLSSFPDKGRGLSRFLLPTPFILDFWICR